MPISDRLLSLGCLLGLVAVLGWALRPQSISGTTAQARSPASREGASATPQAPAIAIQRVAAPSSPTLPRALLATPTRTPTPISIGNLVWSDFDGDGLQDTGEQGLGGVTVRLWNATKTQVIDSTVTDSNGIYRVVAPVPGSYRVQVIAPGGDPFTLKDQGGDDLKDSDVNQSGADLGFTDAFTIAPNVISISKIDAGIRPPPTPTRTPTPISIGNLVWNDLDGNGLQDTGEPGLNGITVRLWNATKTQVIDSTVTDSNGIYRVVAPVPGSYRVQVIAPGGALFTLKDQSDDLKDSDINQSGADLGFTDAFTIAPNVISITKIDAGLINVPATPTLTATALGGSRKIYLPLLVR